MISAEKQGLAQDAYRSNMPAVVTPDALPQSADLDGMILRDFLGAYERAGRPKLVVFWNRELSDAVATGWIEKTVEDKQFQNEDSRTSETVANADETLSIDEGMSSGKERKTKTTRSEAIDHGARDGLAEESDWKLAEGFRSAMLGAGAILIDRAAMLRIAGKDVANARPNVQAIEAEGLAGSGDYLIELLLRQEPSSPTGIMFRIDVKAIATGRLVASTLTQGMPPLHGNQARYVATGKGFEMAAAPTLTLIDIGNQVAMDVMHELTAIW